MERKQHTLDLTGTDFIGPDIIHAACQLSIENGTSPKAEMARMARLGWTLLEASNNQPTAAELVELE